MISAWECFHFAVLEMVRSTPIKQRLINAYRRHLVLLKPEQIPEEAREPFKLLLKSLCGVTPQRGEEAVVASVRKLSNQEADDCASAIVEIFGVISRREGGSERDVSVVQLQPVEQGPYEIPALFARS